MVEGRPSITSTVPTHSVTNMPFRKKKRPKRLGKQKQSLSTATPNPVVVSFAVLTPGETKPPKFLWVSLLVPPLNIPPLVLL